MSPARSASRVEPSNCSASWGPERATRGAPVPGRALCTPAPSPLPAVGSSPWMRPPGCRRGGGRVWIGMNAKEKPLSLLLQGSKGGLNRQVSPDLRREATGGPWRVAVRILPPPPKKTPKSDRCSL